MTMSQIKYFVTVAKCLSFTKAADQLFISQPALSKHIKKMEEELNIQLFVRTSNGIRLTPAGSALYMGMSDIYGNYMDLVEKAEKIQKGLDGSLRVGILDQTHVSDFLPQVYRFFKETYPNVDLIFSDGSFKALFSDMYAGNLDMIFTLQFTVENKDSVIYQYVARSDDYIVMSKYHPLAQKEHVTLDDVKDETFVVISEEDNPDSVPLILNICKEHGYVPQVHIAKTLAEQILWVEAGMGVSILDTRCNIRQNPDIKSYKMPSNWDPSLVLAWNQNNYNPLIAVFLKKMNAVLDLEDEDLHGAALDL